VDWKPPAGGNEKLMSILERMKKASAAHKVATPNVATPKS
jgi:hypothetical protein